VATVLVPILYYMAAIVAGYAALGAGNQSDLRDKYDEELDTRNLR
jgi:hypothetical protein